jgi:hypothetical protein
MVSGVIDTADHRKSRFQNRVSVCLMQKVLTRGSRAQMEFFKGKNQS